MLITRVIIFYQQLYHSVAYFDDDKKINEEIITNAKITGPITYRFIEAKSWIAGPEELPACSDQ